MKGRKIAVWIAVGVGVGVAMGAATHALAIWLCVGVILGAVVGAVAGMRGGTMARRSRLRPMTEPNYLDADILAAVGAPRGQHENDLVLILGYVDARQKLLLTHEELEGGLRRLHADSKIRETAHLKYVAGSGGAFSGISPNEYLLACNEYRRWFQEM